MATKRSEEPTSEYKGNLCFLRGLLKNVQMQGARNPESGITTNKE